ncbi:hypothetical protein FE257_010907 [Aspergillus nanangensis]|uniref:GPI transamidase component PIG-S n=1 Tax=Aspergillus nanangensis TaxID=2582783 RepID=A0AAD4CVQ1_ASPNN|nr:hypothetical protein FE257_010907 [Aspergillus nanangensis]
MAKSTVLFFVAVLAATISPNHASFLPPRDASTCPSSYEKCSNKNLPDTFCCPTTSTCVSLDGGTSALCCPKGQSCEYIEPIECDLQQQDATLHPRNPVKTTKLNGKLPTCGDSCCPFGYSCRGDKLCKMDDFTSSKTTTADATSETTKPTTTKFTSESTLRSTSTTEIPSSTISDAQSTREPTIILNTETPQMSTSSSVLANFNANSAKAEEKCPTFTSQAVVAGFFPGALCGAMLALLAARWIRRYNEDRLPASVRVAQHTKRTSSGTLVGISEPIPTEDSACRTDFLLSRSPQRNSEGARSMLHRTGTRVKSLFGSTPKITVQAPETPPPMPTPPPRKPVARRQPSTESIKVYTPPGVFASTSVLKPEPYPTAPYPTGSLHAVPYPNPISRPNTTFSDMLNRSRDADRGPEAPPKNSPLRVPREV